MFGWWALASLTPLERRTKGLRGCSCPFLAIQRKRNTCWWFLNHFSPFCYFLHSENKKVWYLRHANVVVLECSHTTQQEEMWWHGSRSLCVSRQKLSSPTILADAIALARWLTEENCCLNCPTFMSASNSGSELEAVHRAFSPFVRPQANKVQLQVSLQNLAIVSNRAVHSRGACPPVVVGAVLAPLFEVARVLESCATAYLDTVLSCVPSAVNIKEDLDVKSVLRVWKYKDGADCRAHCDPGLVTALLRGSHPGLQVTFDDVKTSQRNTGDYRQECTNGHRWQPIDELLLLTPPVVCGDACSTEGCAPVIVMAGAHTQLLTDQQVRALPHRVCPSVCGATSNESEKRHGRELSLEPLSRVNIVLELRPSRKSWYHFHPSSTERDALRQFVACE